MALAGIESHKSGHPIDVKYIESDLIRRETRPSVVNFLIASNSESIVFDAKTIGKLLRASKRDVKRTLALLKLTRNGANASVLADDTTWINAALPTFHDTLRLFLVVYSHEDLRDPLKEAPELVDLLNNLNEDQSEVMTKMLAILVRKLSLYKDGMKSLARSGFLKKYNERKNCVIDRLIMADNVLLTCYVSDILDYCDVLKEALEMEQDDAQFAIVCRVGRRMYRTKKLKRRLLNLNIPEILRQRAELHGAAKMARTLLEEMRI